VKHPQRYLRELRILSNYLESLEERRRKRGGVQLSLEQFAGGGSQHAQA